MDRPQVGKEPGAGGMVGYLERLRMILASEAWRLRRRFGHSGLGATRWRRGSEIERYAVLIDDRIRRQV
jgi:hypothetical protein